MRYLLFLSMITMALTFTQCKQQSGTRTKNGFEYTLFKQGNGELVKQGDIVILSAQLIRVSKDGKDSIILDTRTNNVPMEFTLPPDSQVSQPAPIVEILPLMRAGDSAFVLQPMDSIKNLEPFMKDWKFIKHTFKIHKIINANQRKLVQDREASVANIVNKDLEDMKAGNIKDIKTTENGVQVVTHEAGTGGPLKEGENVQVYYYGVLKEDGRMFDSGYRKGAPFNFTLGRGEVIRGWDEGVAQLTKGSKATLFIPAKLAYGNKGVPGMIDPNADLVFYVEVL